MTCYTCHSSWAPTCFGCHLSMTANQKMPMLHNEGLTTRNWTSYNFQVLRDDIYMLGVDGTVTGNRIAPVRSACAVLVSSQNNDRDWLYYQQQTVSAEGFSGQAFSTVRAPHRARQGNQRLHRLPRLRPRETTTPGWPSCCCRVRVYELRWAAIFMSPAGTRGMTRSPWPSMRNLPRFWAATSRRLSILPITSVL